jgi:hypothetical protein
MINCRLVNRDVLKKFKFCKTIFTSGFVFLIEVAFQ